MIDEWARNAGVDLSARTAEDESRHQRKRQLVDNHPLAKSGKNYANAASDWFRQFDEPSGADTEDAREVIQWYQYQIAVKIIRALSPSPQSIGETMPSTTITGGGTRRPAA